MMKKYVAALCCISISAMLNGSPRMTMATWIQALQRCNQFREKLASKDLPLDENTVKQLQIIRSDIEDGEKAGFVTWPPATKFDLAFLGFFADHSHALSLAKECVKLQPVRSLEEIEEAKKAVESLNMGQAAKAEIKDFNDFLDNLKKETE